MSAHTTLYNEAIREETCNRPDIQYANDYISVSYVDSEFGPYTVVGDGEGLPRKGGASLISDGVNILLVKQNRYAVGMSTWEIPRGAISGRAESGSLAGLRELREETGIIATGEFTHLGYIQPDSGVLNSRVDLLFTQVETTAETTTDHEVEKASWFPIKQVFDACVNGDIEDAYTIAAIFRARARNLI